MAYEPLPKTMSDGILVIKRKLEDANHIIDVKNALIDANCLIPHNISQIIAINPKYKKFKMLVNNGYNEEFLNKYEKLKLYEIDPIFYGMLYKPSPYHWASDWNKFLLTPETINLNMEAKKYGIVDAFTYRKEFCDHVLLVSFINDQVYTEPHSIKRALHAHAYSYLNTAHALGSSMTRHVYNIKDREYEALVLFTRFHNSHKVAVMMGITNGAVNKHLKNVMHKLDTKNYHELLSKAFRAGIVS